jgi:hypothetical protein
LKEHYRINNKLRQKLINRNVALAAMAVVFGSLYFKWKADSGFVPEPWMIWYGFGVFVLANIPSSLIYLNYYLQNKDTEFTLDFEAKTISIKSNGRSKKYLMDDIENSTYHVPLFYKHRLDKSDNYPPRLISFFGYWDLQFRNGDRYFLTNILHDFILSAPKAQNTKYRFRFFPYIKKADSKPSEDWPDEKEKTRLEDFVLQYQTKNERQLRQILNSRYKYQEDAGKAAELVLEEKFSNSTNSEST